MIKKIKPAIIIISALVLVQGVSGQDKTNIIGNLRQKFESYLKSVPREEIFVHSDRDDYIAGEEMWFTIYLLDRQTGKPSASGCIAYFELLNSENRPVVQKRVSLGHGFGMGQAELPDSISSGNYTIRAYTSYMKNFLPYNCFMKDIRIFNTFTVKSYQTQSVSNNIFKHDSSRREGSVSSGISLKVNNHDDENLQLTISADERFRADSNDMCYLFIQTHGVIDHASLERLTGEKTSVTIPKSFLTSGVNQITIFNSIGQPVCEKYIYTPSREPSPVSVRMTDSCGVRSKVSLVIDQINGSLNAGDITNLSISVSPLSYFPEGCNIGDYMIFGSEFGIEASHLPGAGNISKIPQDLMDTILSGVKSNWIDWKKIIAGDLPPLKYPIETGSHYLRGKLITRNSQLSAPGKYILMSSPGKEALFQYAATDRDGGFSFTINADERLNDLIIQPAEGDKNSTVKIESSFPDNYYNTEIHSKTVPDNAPMSYFSKLSVNYQVNRIYGISSKGDTIDPSSPTTRRIRFYGKPDIGLKMADYIKLPVMQEVFFELLPGVFLKNKKNIYEISVADPLTNKVYDTPPTLMIDGVIINDPGLIANLDPEIVDKIDAVKEKYYVGDYNFTGIINIITHSADFSSVQLPGYAVRIPYRVTEPVISFVSPEYSTDVNRNKRIPDFRNTLYWNPSAKPGNDGKIRIEFWSSDVTSDYEVNIQGIRAGNKPVSFRKTFSVR